MAGIKWSTPRRINGKKTLPLIPNEIYLDIIDLIEQDEDATEVEINSTLSNLALVCRFFSATCLPRVFKYLRFFGDSNCSKEPQRTAFCRDLNSGKEPARSLAPFVHECYFHCWIPVTKQLDWAFTAFLNIHAEAMTKLVNLEILHFHRTPINEKLFKEIGTLKKLRSLAFVECVFNALVGKEDIISKSLSGKLESFKLLNPIDGSDPRVLEILARVVSSPKLQMLHTSEMVAARTIMTQAIQYSIHELKVPRPDVLEFSLLRQFLERTPSLKALSILSNQLARSEKIFSQHPLSLSRSALPKLRFLECHYPQASDLVFGRPIESIVLRVTTMVSLTQMGDCIHLEWARNDSVRNFQVKAFAPAIRSLPRWHFDLEAQHEVLVAKFVPKFPNIVCVQFVDFMQWKRESEHATRWRPAIPRSQRRNLASTLASLRPMYVKDYDGFLAELFRPNEMSSYIRDLLEPPCEENGND